MVIVVACDFVLCVCFGGTTISTVFDARVSNCETTIFHRFLLVDGIRFKFRTLEGFGGHFRLARWSC